MINIILHGGFIDYYPNSAKKLFSEVASNLGTDSTVLICLFASESQNYKTFVDIKAVIHSYIPDFKGHFKFATAETFLEDVSSSDLIIIRGGDPNILLTRLKSYDLDKLKLSLANSTVLAISAGAYAFSKYYLNVAPSGVISLHTGLGLLNVKTVVHYESDFYIKKYPGIFSWEKVDSLFSNAFSDLDYVKLEDGQYKSFITKF